MRNIFSVVLLLLAVGVAQTSRAQSGGEQQVPVVLSWTRYASLPNPNSEDEPRRVPSFVGATHGAREVIGTYALRLPGTVGTGELRDAVYEPFPATDVKLLGNTVLPATPALRVRFGTEARQPYSYVLLQPARRNPQTGQAERLLSFTYVYQPSGAALQRGLASRPHTKASVLNTDDWYKVGVPNSGVYKLDQATLKTLGLPVASLDPHKVQLYGNATGILPQANSAPRPDDLVENNIYFVGNNDNTFDAGEYFLFYARGPHVWRPSQPNTTTLQNIAPGYFDLLGEGGRYKHLTNVYCDTAYYFVRVGSDNGRRIAAAVTPTAAPSGAPITTFLDRRFYEHDLVNVLHSGRRWLGESFSATNKPSRDFVFTGDGNQPLADLVAGDTLRLTSSVATTALAFANFSVALNGSSIGSQSLVGTTGGAYFSEVANNDFRTFTVLMPSTIGNDPKVTLSFNSGDPAGSGYLDYLELVVKRQLRLSTSFLEFNSLNYKRGLGTVGTFVVANATGAQVWETTNPRRPLAQTLSSSGSFVAYTDSVREFVAVQPGGTFSTPRLFGRVPNQNLHDLNNDGKLDLVIVTYPPFRAQAERLAQHRRDYNGLNVAVVTTKQVYNEYSSGGQDVTAIRDLMKQVYDRNPDPTNRRNYLLLFGDASYDYKSSPYNDASQEPAWWATRTPFRTTSKFDEANQNFVPTYESRESFSPLYGDASNPEGSGSYSSEDYYGLLDDTEGAWTETATGVFETCDIGIGRLPVRTPIGQRSDDTQARQVVEKIIDYDSPASFGKWRNYITFTSDDTDAEHDNQFATESETYFAANVKQQEPAYNLRKDYLDLFPQQSVAAGQRSPAAVAAIDAALEQGSLMIGYTGHGGPRGLADEQIITNASLLGLKNQHRLTFFVTGTCDLSTYDNPDLTSAGEQVLTDNATGGAVGLFTTTRVVQSFSNQELVNNFYTKVLTRNASQVLPFLGLAASTAKNTSFGGDLNNRNYTLLADPTTRLAYPMQRVVLDSINGHHISTITTTVDVLQALSLVRMSGHIENNGVLNASFGGTADITVFDKPITVKTLGDGGQLQVPVETQESVIYGGQATVRSGRFTVKFIVPKDIAYNVGLGKISLYAADPTNRVDAQGYQHALIGSAALNPPADTTPPLVQLFMTDETFVSGGTTGLSPLFIAHLTDQSGINTSSTGIGHDLTATLDNDQNKVLVMNDFYTSDLNNFMSGRVRYPYKDLAPGPHTIKFKAWDTYNNSAEASVDFIAAQSEQLALDHVLNYPNPFSNLTTFHFDQNHPGEELDVQVQIFTIAGRLVKTLRTTVPGTAHVPASPHDPSLTWNGHDEYDDQLARGVYVYRVSIRLASGGDMATKFEKLVLLN
ncbi:MAG: type IX secretion system sortase PorU [Janthinobacterium lividum]